MSRAPRSLALPALIGLALLLLLALAGTRALADTPGPNGPPGGPCAGGSPPWFCQGHGDGIVTVTTEPPGPNCQAGGLKVVVQHGRRDGDGPKRPDQVIEPGAVPSSEDPGVVNPVVEDPNGRPPRPRPAPRPDPADETFFVCNGIPGQPGATGPAGPTGPPGPQGPAGPSITVPVQPKVCQSSTRIGVRLFLPPRLARFGVVRLAIAKVNGPLRFDQNVRTRIPRTGPGGVFVFVPIRNRNCGPYLVTVSRPGVEPVVQVWNITGRFGLTRTTITG